MRTAGDQYLVVTNDTFSTSSQGIIVTPDAINDFNLIAPMSVAAGAPFVLTATEARDSWGNLSSGTIVIEDSVGGGPSPDGTDPVLTPIPVVAGSGWSSQILYDSEPTILKGIIV
jgi:hypothetical protein